MKQKGACLFHFLIWLQLVQIDRRITKTFEEVCQDILDKKSFEFVGAYELMKHDKMKM